MPTLRDHAIEAAEHPDLERRDLHEADDALAAALTDLDGDVHHDWKPMSRAADGATIEHGGKVYADIGGMGKVYDWRDSPWTPVNGGQITPLVAVHHIPVIHNAPGLGDFVTLRNVLVAQGLMVQNSTDSEGNVALFTPRVSLCYQARGLNQQSWGCEHMHFDINEAWTRAQLRAAGFVVWHGRYGVKTPFQKARLTGGNGIAIVHRRGQTSHAREADAAGYHDRSDPGHLFWVTHWPYVVHCANWFDTHKTMNGA